MNPVSTRQELKLLQKQMADLLFRPLNADWDMEYTAEADNFIKPNDRLTSFERLEIYSRGYWFRVLDSFYDDYPGLRAILGDERFLKLATAYLAKHPSSSFTLRNLGSRLVEFMEAEPRLLGRRRRLALDMARFEWAQIVAFDEARRRPITTDQLLDADPAELRLGLQPYLCLLKLGYGVDEFLLAVKADEEGSLRGDASNAVDSAPEIRRKKRHVRLPAAEEVYLAVHRHDNMLYHKRLEKPAFVLLSALGSGAPIQEAIGAAVEACPEAELDWPAAIRDWFDNWSYLGWLTPFRNR